MHGKAGAGRAYRLESRYDDEIQQDIDGHARCRHKVKLLEAAVGGEQGAENVCRRKTEETAHQEREHVGVLPDAHKVGGFGFGLFGIVHQMHDFLTVEDAHNHDDTRHGHNHVERGLDQVVQFQFLRQCGGKHGQQHDGEEVGDVVACVEEAVGAAVDAGLHTLVVQETLQQHRFDAAVDAHQQDEEGERQTLSQDPLEKLEVELEAEMLGMAQDDGQGEDEGDDVGHGLGLQVPYGVEPFFREPAGPKYEAHDDDGQHAVENGEDAVLFEQ